MLKSLGLHGILSFKDTSLELKPLNILIGANGSGKSNLIEAISILQAAPRGLPAVFHKGGWIGDWFWQGEEPSEIHPQTERVSENRPTYDAVSSLSSGEGEISAIIAPAGKKTPVPLRYTLRLRLTEQGELDIAKERLETEVPYPGHKNTYVCFSLQNGHGIINEPSEDTDPNTGMQIRAQRVRQRKLKPETLTPGQSVFHERRDPDLYPEIDFVSKQFDSIRLYREWTFGRRSAPRLPQPSDQPNAFVDEDASNLALVLNRMERDGSIKKVEEYLRDFMDSFERISVQIEAGTAQLFIRERGMQRVIPATRLSDGTLRILQLLAILCHPAPPPLVCMEEPELGLHPDAISMLAKLLKDASERTQLVITTHSDTLVDEFTEDPESVVVCEKGFDGETNFSRLDAVDLREWLERYSLGELWRKGEIGGNRW